MIYNIKRRFLMKKIGFFFLLLLVLAPLHSKTTLAEEILTYSLEEGGTQTVEFQALNGEILQIQVQEVPKLVSFRSTISVPNRGIYKVSASLTNQWNVTYYVSIDSSFKITNTSGFSIKTLTGSLKNSTLSHTSTQAIAAFERKIGLITKKESVKATLSGKSLIIN